MGQDNWTFWIVAALAAGLIVTGILGQRSLGPLRLYARLVRLAVHAAVRSHAPSAAPRLEENLHGPVRAPGRPGI